MALGMGLGLGAGAVCRVAAAVCLLLSLPPAGGSPPIFIDPTPGLAVGLNITAFIGVDIDIPFRVRAEASTLDPPEAQLQYRPLLEADEDPGLPNVADLTPPQYSQTLYLNSINETIQPNTFFVARTLTWAPQCDQADDYLVVISAANADGNVSKPIRISVAAPTPEIIDFDNNPLTTRVGCTLALELHARERNTTLRALGNPNYSQAITVSYARLNPRGGREALAALEGASFEVFSEPNEWGGVSAGMSWVPVRGQEAFVYEVCFHVRDTCHITEVLSECVNITVHKCQICLHCGQTLQSVAAEYGTDYLSLYTMNVNIENPDRLPQGAIINTGVVYRVREGDSLLSVSTRFFTPIPSIASVNPDLAFVLDHSLSIIPGDRLCLIPPVCNVRCNYDECYQLGEAELGLPQGLVR